MTTEAHLIPRSRRTRLAPLAAVGAVLVLFAGLFVAPHRAVGDTTTVPAAPTGVVLTLTTNGARAVMSWTNPTGGGQLSYDLVSLVDVTNSTAWSYYGRSARCYGCTSYTFNGLLAGHKYWATMQPFGPAGPGPMAYPGNIVTADQSACTSQSYEACLQINATTAAGTVSHAGSGVLNAGDTPDTWMQKIAPTWWRYATGGVAQPSYGTADRAKNYGATAIEVLSDDWAVEHTDPATGVVEAPWTNNWDDWNTFVQAKVAKTVADGRSPSYWQVWNEPGGNVPNLGSAVSSFTTAVQLELYRQTWNSVHAGSATAKLTWVASVGLHDHADEVEPTTMTSYGTPYPGQFGLDQFLTFLQTNGLSVDLLTWHQIGQHPWLDSDDLPASVMRRDVAAARKMLDDAGMTSVPIAIDEYTSPIDHTVPSWTVDYLNGIEESGVIGAMRACWWDQDPTGLTNVLYDGCGNGMLDNLLTPVIGTLLPQPRATLWVYDFYRQMTGNRLAVTSSSDFTSALASSASSRSVRVMLGRHWTCVPGSANLNCLIGALTAPPPANELVNVTVPNGTWAISAMSIPPVWGGLTGPITKVGVITSANVRNGQLAIAVPSVADGEVVTLTLTKIR